MKHPEKSNGESIENFVLVIGAMKSGTTTLFQYLRQHPQIAASRRKEPNFFGLKSNWAKGPAYYHRLWPHFDPEVHRYALEASTHYTKMKTAKVSQRIQKFGKNFRFIYIVRNPVDRIESALAHNIAKGTAPFEIETPSNHTIEISRYARQLDMFRAGLDDPAILILDFDELRRAPLAVADRCVRFLGIDPTFVFSLVEPANTRKSTNLANEFQLSAEQRATLAEQLRGDIIEFRDRYGFDVSGWGLL